MEVNLMFNLYILMSSDYIDGTRIALDITSNPGQFDTDLVRTFWEYIKKECGEDILVSMHMIPTESDSWGSVPAYDPYFEGVKCIKTVEEFASRIKRSRVLSGKDVAMYILTQMKCTHYLLENLVYFAYADYLRDYSEQLFEDQIYAFTHGPIIKSVYETYIKSGHKGDRELHTNVEELPARCRILFARQGIEKVCSINATIRQYGQYTVHMLEKHYQKVTNKLKKYNYVEFI